METESAKNIQSINKETVHRICSGQVVLNLATAVKELLENSLDAGATVVDVRLREYGSDLIEVSDNGHGVAPCNFQALTLKHHTSKLQNFGDLVTVETFGFRGEALSSLCALSQLSVTTRHASADCGSRIFFDNNGLITSCSPIARQVGTTVTLENIFSTLPVRQKEFHRNLKREFYKMNQLLNAYCLVSTNVKITCSNHSKKGGRMSVAATQGCATVRENIACVFGTKQLGSLLEVKTVSPSSEVLEQLGMEQCSVGQLNSMFQLDGLVSNCVHGQGRGYNDRQFYYVNSRPCEPTKVMKAVNEVYRQYNAHQHPFVFLNIHLARDAVDINVTPDKRQVFVEHEKLLIATVKASLQALYEKIPSTYTMNNIPSSVMNSLPPPSPSADLSPLARLSQWRHQAVNKRSSIDPPGEKLAKQMKLDSILTKTEKSTTFLNIVAKDNNASCFLNTQSDKISVCGKTNVNKERGFCENEGTIEEKKLVVSSVNCSAEDDKKCVEKRGISDSCDIDILPISKGISHMVDTKETSSFCELLKLNQSVAAGSDLLPQNSSDSDYSSQVSTVSENILLLAQSSSINEVNSTDTPLTNDDSSVTDNGSTEDANCGSSSQTFEIDSEAGVVCDRESECRKQERGILEVCITMADLRKLTASSIEKKNIKDNARVRFRTIIDPTKNEQAEYELSREISKTMFAKMEVVGQFNLGFIIARLDSDLFIVDQHATDEKYNFETLQSTTTISSQKLVVPQALELTAVNEVILMDNINIFKANGFEFIIDENAATTSKVKLSSLPMSRNWTFGKEDIDELLFMLQDAPQTMCRPLRVRAMFASRACRKSVMIGTALRKAEMKRLLTHMGEIEQPWNCPHGRPTMRHLINLDFI